VYKLYHKHIVSDCYQTTSVYEENTNAKSSSKKTAWLRLWL